MPRQSNNFYEKDNLSPVPKLTNRDEWQLTSGPLPWSVSVLR